MAVKLAKASAAQKRAPGPPWYRIPESLSNIRNNPLKMLLGGMRDYGDLVRFQFGPIETYLLAHPDHVQRVFVDNNANYSRQTISYEKMMPALGRGLLTTDGSFWLKQRRTVQPAFHRQKIAMFAGRMVQATEAMLSRWQSYETTGETFDAAEEMMRLALHIAADTLLSADVSRVARAVGDALTVINKHVSDDTSCPIELPHCVPTPRNQQFQKAIRTLDKIVYDIIDERRSGKNNADDLLSMLMHAKDPETNEGMDDKQLRDELLTILLAGHETTANTLAWTWYLLSTQPTVAERLHDELDQTLQGKTPGLEDLPKLAYTKMVLQESMRLYPPAWIISRAAVKDDVIGGYKIPKKATVFMSSYVTHRHPKFWKNPEGFDPGRFEEGKNQDRHRFAYFPFGGGGHLCIGKDFAMMEAPLLLAAIAQRYCLDLVPGHPVEPEPLITLRPRYGLKMTLRPRA
ncbi:MAG: cytochrome P450 [Elusimicrobia bacterium]|nr:cytochrome P450 [Elusimicrobiota bacterium]